MAATLPPSSGLVMGAGIALVLLWLGAKARFHSRRLSRSFTRSLSLSSPRKQRAALGKPRMAARMGRSRRASWRFRKAVLISVLLAAAWLFTQLHTTH